MNRLPDDPPAATPLRVAHLIGGGDTGGAMQYLLPLLSALRDEGCDARLICLGAGGLADEAARRRIPCEVLPMAHPWDGRMLPALRRSISGGGWDIVHTHGMRANLPVRAIVGPMRRRPPLFTTVHSDLVLDYPNAVKAQGYRLLDRLSTGAVDGFFCVSKELAARLAARGVSRSRIQVVHPGIEDSGKSVTVQAPVVGTVARLVPVKDVALFLEAARLARQEVPGLRAVVVGDGPERARLEQAAEESGLDATVDFRGEVRPARAVLGEFQVFVLTSVSEGVPLAVLEAMCAGLPVVATAVGGVPELLEDGVSGFLVQRDEDRGGMAAALADRVSALLTDAGLRARMGAAARKRALHDFSTSSAARKTLRAYRRGLAAGGEDGWQR